MGCHSAYEYSNSLQVSFFVLDYATIRSTDHRSVIKIADVKFGSPDIVRGS